ncbi:putative GTP-binding protein 6 [Adelges cooleyi]|uniref:putative GTP-binding protein 6 n=1 Tax=Adelges cooleyi TaxID=133065 RepID=UPI00217F45C1|nr:putative GTP-binding protein 6 [Adelges cooleyi]
MGIMIRYFRQIYKTFNYRFQRCYFTYNDEDVNIQEFISRELKLEKTGHQVLVIQPYIKWGVKKDRATTPEIKLAESESLINTLRDWKVRDSMKIGVTAYRRQTFLGPGSIDNIAMKIKQDQRITAVFISTNVLKPIQHQQLEHFFKVPVYDRYLIVIQIFREHAFTKEAKLQVALAEVPYMWSRIRGLQENYADRLGTEAGQIALSSNMVIDDKKDLLKEYEKKLKKSVNKLRSHREHLRNSRKNKNLPIVAVVGYTNTGKTSLVKALSGDSDMSPKDCLFATLDVTVHGGLLPSNLKALYIDTIGFISDIPTGLMEPFVATLEDAMFADVIVHVRDVSHPNVDVQKEHVENTLKNLNINMDLLNSIISVANKIDCVENLQKDEDSIYVSCTKEIGLEELKAEIEKKIIQVTGRQILKIRVRTGQKEYEWLRSNTAVLEIENDGDFSIVKVIATKSDIDVFKHLFIYKTKSKSL